METYRQLFFEGILGFTNPIPDQVWDKLPKFSGNNIVTSDEHLKSLIDVVNDYEFVHEHAIMKPFVQSLTVNVRDWYRALPAKSIHSWYDLQHSFKEKFKRN